PRSAKNFTTRFREAGRHIGGGVAVVPVLIHRVALSCNARLTCQTPAASESSMRTIYSMCNSGAFAGLAAGDVIVGCSGESVTAPTLSISISAAASLNDNGDPPPSFAMPAQRAAGIRVESNLL